MSVVRWILAVFVVLVCLATWVPRIQIAGIRPDLLLGIVFLLALNRGPEWGVWSGFAIGLLVSTEQPAGLGAEPMALSLAGLVVGRGSFSLDRYNPVVQLLLLLVAALVSETVRVIWTAGGNPGSIPGLWFRWALPGAFYTALAVPILGLALSRILGRRRWLVGAP